MRNPDWGGDEVTSKNIERKKRKVKLMKRRKDIYSFPGNKNGRGIFTILCPLHHTHVAL